MKKVVLHCTQGTSNKTYVIEKVAAPDTDGLFLVNFAHGRRGSTLKMKTKTKFPVTEIEADKIFNSLHKEKLGKYREDTEASSGGASFTVENAVPTRFPVHLLTEIGEEKARELIENDDYYAQEKHDGERRVLVLEGGGAEIYGSNKRGLRVGIPDSFTVALAELIDRFDDQGRDLTALALDGEAIGEVFYAFDLLEMNQTDFRRHEFYQRFGGLEALFNTAGENSLLCQNLILSPLAVGTEAKTALFNRVRDNRGEGIVFKHARSLYQPGQSKSQLKFKFYQDATCLVAGHHATKDSISLQVAGADGTLIDIGNCKVPTNQPFPSVGAFVDVRYLYAYPNGGSLYQPVYKRERTDKTEADQYDSLKFKAD